MSTGGAIVSFELASYEEAAAAATRFQIFRRATSLGGVESVVEHRASVNPLAPPGLLRLSVGLEAPADLIADLDRRFPLPPPARGVDRRPERVNQQPRAKDR